MSIRLLGGRAKSFSLQVPAQGTRPTSVILRRKIFDSYQDLSETIFIDCCAGSGAMSFEAWSRGAQKIIMLETSKVALKTLKNNVQLFVQKYPVAKNEIEINPADCLKWLSRDQLKRWDDFILFFDPPYEDHDLYWNFLKKLSDCGALPGQLWLESDEQKGIKLEQLTRIGLKCHRQYTHGTSYLCTVSLEDGLNLSF